MAVVAPPPNDRKRVKVYELRDNDWFDRGTGLCSAQVIDVSALSHPFVLATHLIVIALTTLVRHAVMLSGLRAETRAKHKFLLIMAFHYLFRTNRESTWSRRMSQIVCYWSPGFVEMMDIRSNKVWQRFPALDRMWASADTFEDRNVDRVD